MSVAIHDYLTKALRDIARLLEISPSTLYDYLARRGVKVQPNHEKPAFIW